MLKDGNQSELSVCPFVRRSIQMPAIVPYSCALFSALGAEWGGGLREWIMWKALCWIRVFKKSFYPGILLRPMTSSPNSASNTDTFISKVFSKFTDKTQYNKEHTYSHFNMSIFISDIKVTLHSRYNLNKYFKWMIFKQSYFNKLNKRKIFSLGADTWNMFNGSVMD